MSHQYKGICACHFWLAIETFKRAATGLCVYLVFRVTLHKHKLPLIYCRSHRFYYMPRIDFAKFSVSGCIQWMFAQSGLFTPLDPTDYTIYLGACVRVCVYNSGGCCECEMWPIKINNGPLSLNAISPYNEVSQNGFMRCQWHLLVFIELCMHTHYTKAKSCHIHFCEMRAWT